MSGLEMAELTMSIIAILIVAAIAIGNARRR
jgi:hypothetical protein